MTEKREPTNVLKLLAKHLLNIQRDRPPPPLIPGATLGSQIRKRRNDPPKKKGK